VSVIERLDALPAPVFAIPTPSFTGSAYHGDDLLLEKLARDFVVKQQTKTANKVNVFGLIPGSDIFYKGNLKEIKRVLRLIGIEANTFIGDGEGLSDIRDSGGAALNIILSDVYAPLTAAAFQKTHGIPFIREQLPIGFFQTESFLHTVGKALGIEQKIIDGALRSEQEIYFDYFERIADTYNDIDLQRYGVVAADSNYAPAITNFISDELGWIPHLTMVTDQLDGETRRALEKRFEGYASGLSPKVYFDASAASLRHYITGSWERNRNHTYYEPLGPLVLFGSSFEKDFAEENGYPLLNVSFPSTNKVVFNKAYAGFNGGLTLAEDAFSLLGSGR
jgi:nitrogenase molybdenum-iron protein beta chain